MFESTPNLSASSFECVTSINEKVRHPISMTRVSISIACHRRMASDHFLYISFALFPLRIYSAALRRSSAPLRDAAAEHPSRVMLSKLFARVFL